MLKTVSIRGVIVDSFFDQAQGWLADLIAKGSITPESRIRSALASVTPDDELVIDISSPGGDVFAGGEMLNAIIEAKGKAKSVAVKVGSIAASMAANITLALSRAGVPVKAHANSKFMFHGSMTGNWGGNQSMTDTSAILGKINADSREMLIAGGVPAATVDDWYAEGRAGWLTAEEAKGYGIVSEIIGDTAQESKFKASDLKLMEGAGFKIAALGIEGEADAADDGTETTEKTEGTEEAKPETEGTETAPAENTDAPPAETVESVKADMSIKLSAQALELNETIAKRDKLISSLQSEKDKAVAEKNVLAQKVNELNAALASYTERALAFVPTSAQVKSWKEAMQVCGGDYVEARKRFPEFCAGVKKAK